VEEKRRIRVRRAARDALAVRPREEWSEGGPVDRRPALAVLVDLEAVAGEAQRDLPGFHHLGEERMPLAHRKAVRRDELAEIGEPLLLVHPAYDRLEPVGVVRLDGEAPFPLRVEQVLEP